MSKLSKTAQGNIKIKESISKYKNVSNNFISKNNTVPQFQNNYFPYISK